MNLKQYIDLGLKLTKIHRGIKLNQKPWMVSYIDKNTQLRSKATNDFEKDFFKLMNNSVFRKTMENIRNRTDIQLVSDEVKTLKLTAKTNFKRATIISENLVAIHMGKQK